jgi:hypothetical protein
MKDQSMWEPRPMQPIPTWAELWERVLERSDKRMPKWRFRLAPELLLEVQPQPVFFRCAELLARGWVQELLAFDCRAIEGVEPLAAAALEKLPGAGAPAWCSVRCRVYADAGGWWLKPRSSYHQRGSDAWPGCGWSIAWYAS